MDTVFLIVKLVLASLVILVGAGSAIAGINRLTKTPIPSRSEAKAGHGNVGAPSPKVSSQIAPSYDVDDLLASTTYLIDSVLQNLAHRPSDIASSSLSPTPEGEGEEQEKEGDKPQEGDNNEGTGELAENGNGEDTSILNGVSQVIKAVTGLLAARYGGAAFLCLFGLGAIWVGFNFLTNIQ